jgi:hypothetical protein
MIYIPTYKRSHDLRGKDYFNTAIYVVPESQKDEYLKVLDSKRIITIPDEYDGNIVKKRNWILKNIQRPIVMVDDDVESIGYFELRSGIHDGNHRKKILPSELLIDWISHFNDLCYEFGFKMWGVAQNEDNRIYKEYHPFSFSKIILGPFQAHLDHNLLFDERVGTKDDYDMSLQQLCEYKGILRLNKYHYNCQHGDNKGGIVSYRTKEKEIEYCKNIMMKWGKRIISYQLPPQEND